MGSFLLLKCHGKQWSIFWWITVILLRTRSGGSASGFISCPARRWEGVYTDSLTRVCQPQQAPGTCSIFTEQRWASRKWGNLAHLFIIINPMCSVHRCHQVVLFLTLPYQTHLNHRLWLCESCFIVICGALCRHLTSLKYHWSHHCTSNADLYWIQSKWFLLYFTQGGFKELSWNHLPRLREFRQKDESWAVNRSNIWLSKLNVIFFFTNLSTDIILLYCIWYEALVIPSSLTPVVFTSLDFCSRKKKAHILSYIYIYIYSTSEF